MTNTKIKAVIFDVGGVLIRTMDRSYRQGLEARLGLSHGEADDLVFGGEMGTAAQLGKISSEKLWGWIGEHLALDEAGVSRFREEFFGGDHLDTSLVDYIRALHTAGYQTAIISNAMDDLNHVVTNLYPMADAFDLIVGSAYEGIMKPNAAIFERTLKRLGRQPAETIFVDDFAHNIEGAKAVGMHGVHFTPGIDIETEFATYGITPNRNI